ncbi:TlpA family protein disulfide reductase [Parapedobacter sp. GCM10030251]|uniref:TlpA family protein disulfide reductase n=1 Tax=Parapedobacter sp. GCM10030251 TaxID=3273419 RepID=UPI003623AD44
MMYIESMGWLLPSLTLKIAFILIIAGVATRGKTQTAETPLKAAIANPLPTGEPIPDELWSVPLTLWNAANNSTKTITLNDYRGKVIILDFWATWCKSCITNMPRMHRLQDQFPGNIMVLPVTYEPTETVAALFARSKAAGIGQLRGTFQTILLDATLKEAFPNPNGTIPYFAVIGKDGSYKGPVTPEYLTENLIADLTMGNAAGVPRLRAAPVKPLMDWSASLGADWQKPVGYHTMFSHYMHGAGEPTGRRIDSLKGTEWQYYMNQPLLRLFGVALSSPLPRQANRRIMLVDSAVRFDDHSLRNPKYEPFAYNYCYEATYPIGAPKDAVKARMLADLNALTGVKGQLITKSMPSLIIQGNGNAKSHPAPNNEVQWLNMASVAWFLNQRYDIAVPPVLDETGFDGQIWMDDSARKGTIADVRRVLQAQGFDLVEEDRKLEMFLLTDGDSKEEIGQLSLTLTKHGYVREEGSHE